ncbi:MAG: hypothetical protein H6Q80_1467 [Deltaproteobacteria bacterium]|jgi:hypothetical protein|nr:hypothetical protein [Deltaproteobacteria bacterium]
MKTKLGKTFLVAVITALLPGIAHSFQFQASESVSGNLDMQLTLGAGIRTQDWNPQLVGDPTVVPGANTGVSSNGDDGDLNYEKGQLYTTYLKFTPELLLKFPMEFKFMARATFLYDFMATHTDRTDLDKAAKNQISKDAQLLDLWVSKDMNIGDQRARFRLGNQVVSWGESIFAIGGINQTNSLDFQKLSIPGTQLKEAVLPAPIFSIASGLGRGVNLEGYYQFQWNRNRLPPVGTYFSVADILGKGRQPLFFNVDPTSPDFVNFGGLDPAADPSQANTFAVNILQHEKPGHGQYGFAMHYKPEGVSLDVGLYFMNYHDKMPVLTLLAGGTTAEWEYLENRKLYGISTNFPLGNWAIGWELSYRPKDAISLTSCYNPGGPLDGITNGQLSVDCPMWIDNKKYQMHLTGLLSLTPGDHGWFLDLLWADTATFIGEVVWIRYPGVSPGKRYERTIDGVPVMQAADAGYAFWVGPPFTADLGLGVGTQTYNTIAAVGDANSIGFTVDFNWNYDNKIIKGWQVVPGLTFFDAVSGYTPTLTANYLEGAKSLNIYVNFIQNVPTNWQAGINYLTFWGKNQLLADRDFIGAYLTRNF